MMPQGLVQPTVMFEGAGPLPVSSIYCIGRNYAEHAAELKNPVPQGEPVVFLKSRSSIRGLTQSPMGFSDESFHHEVELVLYLNRNLSRGEEANWPDVGGIALGIDVTRREVQSELKRNGLPWTTAKSFAGSAVLSPFLPRELWSHQQEFSFSLTINESLRQQGNTSAMIFDVPAILTYLASFNSMQEGDIIFTGTPAGVGPIQVGDTFALELTTPNRKWQGVF